MPRTLHFPFAIYERIDRLSSQTADAFIATTPPSLNGTGKGESHILRGSYDLLESINVHLYCPVGAAFSLSFTRYTPDGHKQLVCDGVYSVTNNDGRWGIQLVSTIVHEADFIGIPYPDAEAATTRGGAELSGGVRVQERGHPQRSDDKPRHLRTAVAGWNEDRVR